jgi:chemotaxis protein CheC
MGATICRIDGEGCNFPTESCFCQCQGSPCIYWSYWRLTEGEWRYSNIGAGNAATALARMLDRKIDMKVPQIQVMKFSEVSDILGAPEELVVGILLGIQGDITGNIMFVLDVEATRFMLNLVFARPVDTELTYDDMECSAIMELGNILAGSYLSALSTLTNLNIMPDVPSLAIDMAAAVLSVPAIVQAKASDTVLYIENEFTDGHDTVMGDLFLIPEEGSYTKLLQALGVS